jgi:hypothetical protein
LDSIQTSNAEEVWPDVEKRQLKVVPTVDPKSMTVVKTGFWGPLAVGRRPRRGKIDFACGRCGKVLLKAVREGAFSDLYITCGRCGAHNLT